MTDNAEKAAEFCYRILQNYTNDPKQQLAMVDKLIENLKRPEAERLAMLDKFLASLRKPTDWTEHLEARRAAFIGASRMLLEFVSSDQTEQKKTIAELSQRMGLGRRRRGEK